ncbi:hypothetical protein KAFR_0D04470 [Kazachstania africana CBS 2517]|uniref:HIT-type domain-containing protein n=1 Tax=Kazachstania africana (strain ATCC 22294 / BCRC 22015 / CBS 2517 / CECT 1963 / NBRC 1671 / NRRL Y-8276) TaxID=1071382 RepID=H2AUP5_KAZAF|nr:hypothetical protein KAFR_0D04470 [Kazachstania africana CBS 2517]CCF58095.1 hypothetical protein KAFR_0D04470 [Kazachstania africana CBS 2517]
MGSARVNKCGVCQKNDSKYKCPKCALNYCSLVCYKNENVHRHDQQEEANIIKNNEPKEVPKSEMREEKTLKSPELDKIYAGTPELKELLKYNTVKFHLHKVYKILISNDGNLTTEMKNQLAIDYLNTLRFGGLHYNEAIEEFCEIFLQKLEKK